MAVQIEALRDGWRFDFKEKQVVVEATRPRVRADHIQADIKVSCFLPLAGGQAYNGEIHTGRHSVTAGDGADKLRKLLSARCPEVEWTSIIDEVFRHVRDEQRAGEPAQHLISGTEVAPLDWLVRPVLQRNQPTILFGDKGTGKSWIALVIAAIVRLSWFDNNLGFGFPVQDAPILWLDWETDEEIFQARMTQLCLGMNIGPIVIEYRHCIASLADDVDGFLKLTEEIKPGLVVIDSLGMAGGQDLMGTEAPKGVYQTLRRYRSTYLMIAHVPKDRDIAGGRRTPYGNAYFENLARASWEIHGVEEPGGIQIALYHRKHNNTPRYQPIGLTLSFDGEAGPVTLSKSDVRASSELGAGMHLTDQILDLLKQGAMPLAQIIELTGKSGPVVSMTLSRLKVKGLTLDLGKALWGLAARES